MALIHKKTFDIIDYTDINEDEYFKSDDLIALTVAQLNLKGYITSASCSGHPFDEIAETLIDNKDTYDALCNGLLCEILSKGKINDQYRIVTRCDINECYILFDLDYNFPTLPIHFKYNDKKLSRDFESNNNCIERIIEIVESMKVLLEWAESL